MSKIISPKKWNKTVRYAVAPVAVTLALLCRLALNPYLGDTNPFMYFFVAIIVSGWLGGLGPGLLATALSTIVVDYFYLPPSKSFLLAGSKEIVHALTFMIVGVAISLIVARMRQAQRRAEQATTEARVRETETRQAGAALRESEQRFAAFMRHSPGAAWIKDLQGRYVWINPEAERIFAKSLDELRGKVDEEIFPPDAARQFSENDRRVLTEGGIFSTTEVLRQSDGIDHYSMVNKFAIPGPDGRPAYIGGMAFDITERKRAEEALALSEARMRTTFDNAALGIVVTDNQDRFVAVNERICKILGYRCEELLGMSVHELTAPEDRARSDELNAKLHEGRINRIDYEKRYLRTDGSPLWVHVTVGAVRDSEGRYLHSINTIEDISQRKAAEEQLSLQAKALDAAANGIIITDPDGTILWANPAYAAMTGYTTQELIGKNPRIVKSGKQDKAFYRTMWETISRGEVWHGSLINRRKDGALYAEDMTISPVVDESGKISRYIAIKQDITERNRMEEALRESEAQFRQLAETVPQLVWIARPDGYVEYFNQHWYDYTGAIPEKSYGHEWVYVLHPDDFQPTLERWQHSLRTGEAYECEYRLRCASDGQSRWFLGRALPVRNERDAIVRWFGTCTDIHEQKMAQEALREADKRKDEFLAMLAHELRNPLAPIRYAVQMLNMSGSADSTLQKQREIIDRQVSHMGRLLDDLLEVSRVTRGKITLRRETVDLRIIARQALDSLRPMIEGREQHLAYEETSSPLLVNGDPTRLEQIMRNLLHNANKYTEANGCIKLSLGLNADHGHDWWAEVHVIDSGIGISPQILPRVFDAFVQADQDLARTQGGLGIGLAMVKNLVQMHGGSVEVHSSGPNKGSEFVVLLALVSDVMGGFNVSGAEQAQTEASKPKRVLVVDDNVDSAASLGELLSLWGHEIQTAHDGRHALAAAREWQPEIILLDIGLPGMDGYEVARQLRENPATASAYLVALTGYGQEEDRRRSQEAGFNRHLTKPVELERLQNLLHEAQAA